MKQVAVLVDEKPIESIKKAADFLEIDYPTCRIAMEMGYGIKGHFIKRQDKTKSGNTKNPVRMLLVYPRGDRPLERGLEHWR